jgi:hypothetical protein
MCLKKIGSKILPLDHKKRVCNSYKIEKKKTYSPIHILLLKHVEQYAMLESRNEVLNIIIGQF